MLNQVYSQRWQRVLVMTLHSIVNYIQLTLSNHFPLYLSQATAPKTALGAWEGPPYLHVPARSHNICTHKPLCPTSPPAICQYFGATQATTKRIPLLTYSGPMIITNFPPGGRGFTTVIQYTMAAANYPSHVGI